MTLRFSRKKIPVPPEVHSVNHEIRKSASTQSDLAILVCDNLKWSPHIINIVARSNRMLGFKYSVIVSTSLTYMLVAFYSCLWSALICRSVVKSALYKVRRLLICFFSKEFNVVQPNSFCRTMNHRMLKKLDLILVTYWHEIKVIVSLYKCKSDIYELDINQFIPFNPPLVLPLVIFVQTCAKPPSSETRTLTELYFYGTVYPQISNPLLQSLYSNLNYTYFIKTTGTVHLE